MNDLPTIILNNGVSIPSIGMGPGILGYSARDSKSYTNPLCQFSYRVYNKICRYPKLVNDYVDAIINSFHVGFRLIDYSSSYGDGRLIGKAIRKSGIDRNTLFLTTRISNQVQWQGNIRECLFQQLKGMNTDYIDLLMFHWPVTNVYVDTWKEMIKLYKEGYCRALGVANCHQHHIEKLMEVADIIPAVNQFEVHPLFTQKTLISYCRNLGIQVESYTALARMDDRLFRLPSLKNIAKKYNKTVAQIVLRWHIQNDLIPVVRSLNPKRQMENISIFDFKLSSDEMEEIDGININARVRYDPDNCDFTIL